MFRGGDFIRNLMMAATKETYFEAHEEKMMKIKEVDLDAYELLEAIPKAKWCKHEFSLYSKSNLSESFNENIFLQMYKPIISMFEWIRTYILGRFATLRLNFNGYKGEIM